MRNSNTTDDMRIDPRLVRLCLEAIYSVGDSHGIDFTVLGLDEKKDFLNTFGKEVIDVCTAQPGGEIFADRVVLWVENPDQNTAGLVFVKRKKNGR